MIDLSILVCSVHTRRSTFLPKILDQLYGQFEALPKAEQARVEIVTLIDNKQIMLGEKRNLLVDLAQGNYVVFVDDDDEVADDYVKTLLKATGTEADVITFFAEVTLDGGEAKICRYSTQYRRDRNTATEYHRIPNHICCVRRELAQKSSFPNIAYGEDSRYAKVLLRHLRTEHQIPRVLYHYRYDAETTETQRHIPARPRQRPGPAIADVVILAKTTDRKTQAMTQKAIDSAIAGANSLPISVIVVEDGDPKTRYRNASMLYRTVPFNYNASCNAGAESGSAPWIVFSNNDVVFHDGWLHELLAAEHPIVSPHEPTDYRQKDLKGNETGYVNGRHLSGWCFMMSRELWTEWGGLPTDVAFWCSDDIVVRRAQAAGIEPMLVQGSIVRHLGSCTLRRTGKSERERLTWEQVEQFNEMFGANVLTDSSGYRAWKKQRSKP